MKNICSSALDLIGRTPLVELSRFAAVPLADGYFARKPVQKPLFLQTVQRWDQAPIAGAAGIALIRRVGHLQNTFFR